MTTVPDILLTLWHILALPVPVPFVVLVVVAGVGYVAWAEYREHRRERT